MIYLLFGTDTHLARKKLHELLALAEKKRPDAELFKLTTENWSEAQFDELLVSQGLFEHKYTVVLDNIFEKKDSKAYVLDKLEEMKNSDQIFLILEGGVDAASLKRLEKFSVKTQQFDKPEGKKPYFNVFAITDGLLEKDKRKLWVDYIESLKKGSAPEEIHGLFFWQVKNMILASRASSQTETGLSPFVYKNGLRGSRNYQLDKLMDMSSELVEMTHRVRTGKGDMDVMLEKWVLGL